MEGIGAPKTYVDKYFPWERMTSLGQVVGGHDDRSGGNLW